MEEKLKDNEKNNYFIDITDKLVPKYKNNRYKYMTINGIHNIIKLYIYILSL